MVSTEKYHLVVPMQQVFVQVFDLSFNYSPVNLHFIIPVYGIYRKISPCGTNATSFCDKNQQLP